MTESRSRPFLWGTATAAYQIEGGAAEDGRGPSIWDTFSHTPGNIERGETGDIACDHYHRFRDDVALLADLGVNAYRFSISWSRVMPDGDGAVNPAGLRFYSDLVDALLAADITPVPTLYHWDLPQALEDRGGWRNRATVDAFSGFAAAVVAELGDRVEMWATLNEPWCSAFIGHWIGRHAPGHRDIDEAFIAAHHLLLAHGRAVEEMRQSQPEGSYGIALNTVPYRPAPGVDAAVIADPLRRLNAVANDLFFDGVLRGEYPKDVLELSPALRNAIQPGDLPSIAASLDWLGVNYYTDTLVMPADEPGFVYPFISGVAAAPIANPTDMGWALTPWGLTDYLVGLGERYANLPQLFITENGAAYDDPIGTDGTISDVRRIDYLRTHIAAMDTAIREGIDVGGYFVWSLMDNFEWSYGYRLRFGLAHVDFTTLQRMPRNSFWWYRSHIAAWRGPAGA